jgi:hypothetical protein
MSEMINLEEARQALRKLTLIAIEANRALYDGLQSPDVEPSPERSANLNRTLEQIQPIREGFMMALRVEDVKLASELRDLINALYDWDWLDTMGLRWNNELTVEKPSGQVVMYNHAVIAMGVLPRLPKTAVTYPYGEYRDIPVPNTPGETLGRIEEVEDTLWAAANDPVGKLSRGAVRRTYGFFEATTWLIASQLGSAFGL